MLENIKDIFIKNLISLREGSGLTQSDMAEAAGVGLSTYQKYEYKTANPGLDKIQKIANKLGVSEADLFRRPIEQESFSRDKEQMLKRLAIIAPALDESQLRNALTLTAGYAAGDPGLLGSEEVDG